MGMEMYNRGAYSPSQDRYFNKVTKVDLEDESFYERTRRSLRLMFKEHSTGISLENNDDLLIFIMGHPVEYHTLLPYGSNDPWLNHGGLTITIYGEGEFTKLGKFPPGYEINNIKVGDEFPDEHCKVECYGFINGGGNKQEIYPKLADPNDILDDGMFTQNLHHGLDPTENRAGDSVEWFHNTTGRGGWDKVSIGNMNTNWEDIGYIGIKNLSCKTVIVIELLHRHGWDPNQHFNKLLIGEKEFKDWGLPFDTAYTSPSEKNGDGHHSFIYLHPKTNQVIVNDSTWGIEDVPQDLIFFDNLEETCPLLPFNPWFDTSCTIPVCANMHECFKPPEPYLDPRLKKQAFEYWNHDIAIAKTGVRIPVTNAYSNNTDKLWVGYWSTQKELLKLQESKNNEEEDNFLLTENGMRILL